MPCVGLARLAYSSMRMPSGCGRCCACSIPNLIAWPRAPQGAADPAWRALVALPTRWTAPRFPLKSADLIAHGVPRGPALGAAMRAAEEAWIAAGFPHDEAALDRIANDAARRT